MASRERISAKFSGRSLMRNVLSVCGPRRAERPVRWPGQAVSMPGYAPGPQVRMPGMPDTGTGVAGVLPS
jgi:hypothetical protein